MKRAAMRFLAKVGGWFRAARCDILIWHYKRMIRMCAERRHNLEVLVRRERNYIDYDEEDYNAKLRELCSENMQRNLSKVQHVSRA